MNRVIVFTLLALPLLAVGQQLNRLGHPLVKNYKPEDYAAAEQNWSIVQDKRGVMYFGNNDKGILEYDGRSWRSIPIPNNSPIRSLAIDDDGTIYVGAVAEIGYLSPNKDGKLEYVSLNGLLLKDSLDQFSDIFKTYCYRGKVYFCQRQYIFIYDKSSIRVVNLGKQSIYSNFLTFNVNDHIYVGSFLKGLRELVGDSVIVAATNGEQFAGNDIYSILPKNSEEAIILCKPGAKPRGKIRGGLFQYHQHTGVITEITPKSKYLPSLLSENIPYNSISLDSNHFGVSTILSDSKTYTTFSFNGEPVEVLNPSTGLQDSWSINAYKAPMEPLWLSLNFGISRAETNTPIRRFAEESGIASAIFDIVRFNGTLYVATFDGVFYQAFDTNGMPRFLPVENVNTSIWCFLVYKIPGTSREILLAGGQPNVFEINGTRAKPVVFETITHTCYSFKQSERNPSIVYIGMAGGIAAIEYTGSGWVDRGYIQKDEIRYEIRSIEEDNDGSLWLGTYVDGIVRLTLGDKVKIEKYNTNQGLPGLKNLFLAKFDDTVYATTQQGLYHFNSSSSRFEPISFKGFNFHDSNTGVSRLFRVNGSSYALFAYKDVTENWVEMLVPDARGRYNRIRDPFLRIPMKWGETIWADPDGTLWIGKAKELYTYNPKTPLTYQRPFNALIRKVISHDSVLFHGTYYNIADNGRRLVSRIQHTEQIPTLPYRFNAFEFEVGATFFEWEEKTQYSWILENNDQDWSNWTDNPRPIYTNIREGDYTFKLKARNIYGIESGIASYNFSIRPPWYRTIIAYIGYFLLFIVFVWLIVRWNTRRLIAEKEHLEQIVKERTAEVVAQKEEIEVQKEKISAQNEEIKSSIQYASRIQNAILTPPDQINQVFPDHFILYLPRDIVSGDFYQVMQVGSKKISIVADCTGHGVPGGFMSMLGMSFLNQIIGKGGELHPATILDQLRRSIINSLHQTGEVGGSKDGMDIAVFMFDEQTMTVEFAGANNPLILIRDNEIQHIKSDKMPIGIHIRVNEPFTNITLEARKGDVLYTFSDGYADQFGGPDMRKFMIKNLKDLLLEIHQRPMAEQREILHQTLLNWHGESPRIDDVVVMGVRL